MVTVVKDGYSFLRLSKRERSLLQYAAQGYSNPEIAKIHGTVVGTEKKRVQIIIQKLKAKNRTHAVVLAIRLGLISPPEIGNDSTGQTGKRNPLYGESHIKDEESAKVR